MHDVVIVSVPLIAILAGILFNRADNRELRTEMNRRFDSLETEMDRRFDAVNTRFDRVDDHLTRFYSITGEHEGRISAIEKRR